MAAVDPIVAEVRAIREQIAAECGFDIRRIIDEARKRQEQSDRQIISVQRERMTKIDQSPAKPAIQPATARPAWPSLPPSR